MAATDRNDARASFSNANADVEIAAAGVNVLSTKRGGGYVAFSGTSMATPHVAGVAALIAAKNPSFSAAQIRSKLDTSVDDLGAAGRDPQFGFGRVNLVSRPSLPKGASHLYALESCATGARCASTWSIRRPTRRPTTGRWLRRSPVRAPR